MNSTPTHHLPSGTLLNGKYRIEYALGEGGFGITYKGTDMLLDMPVAIKEYFPSGYANRFSPESCEVTLTDSGKSSYFAHWKGRFLSEARILAKFNDVKSVVNVRDFFEENGTAYIVMEFLNGSTLKRYVTENGVIPPKKMVSMIIPLLNALGVIHKQGLIHRDISPDNIMVMPDGTLKLFDFGAARDFAMQDQHSLSVMLKPGFAPQEQYRSKGKQGPWTDVYALCATVYFCVTGVVPDDSIQRVFEDEVKLPSELGVAISPHFESVIMRGMSIRSENRFQTMGELLHAFAIKDNNISIINGRTPDKDTILQGNVGKAQNTVNSATKAMPSGEAHQVNKTAAMPSGEAHQVNKTAVMPSGEAHQVNKTTAMPSGESHQVNKTAAMPSSKAHQVNKTAVMPSGESHQINKTAAMPSSEAHQVNKTAAMPSGEAHQEKKSASMYNNAKANTGANFTGTPKNSSDKNSKMKIPQAMHGTFEDIRMDNNISAKQPESKKKKKLMMSALIFTLLGLTCLIVSTALSSRPNDSDSSIISDTLSQQSVTYSEHPIRFVGAYELTQVVAENEDQSGSSKVSLFLRYDGSASWLEDSENAADEVNIDGTWKYSESYIFLYLDGDKVIPFTVSLSDGKTTLISNTNPEMIFEETSITNQLEW